MGAPSLQLLLPMEPDSQTGDATCPPDGGDAQFISQTNLQYAACTAAGVLTVWVTDVRGSPPPPVEGAVVTLYSTRQRDKRVSSCNKALVRLANCIQLPLRIVCRYVCVWRF